MGKPKRYTPSKDIRDHSFTFREETTEDLMRWRNNVVQAICINALMGRSTGTSILRWLEDELERRGALEANYSENQNG